MIELLEQGETLNRHFSPEALTRLLTGPANEMEMVRALRHLQSCRACRAAAADCLPTSGGWPALRAPEARAALIALAGDEAQATVEEMEARGWWIDLRDLGPAEQLKKIRSVAALRSLPVFEAIMAEARKAGRTDPFLGESMARVALLVADHLPEPPFAKALKNDLLGEAFTDVANFRRIAAAWEGSAEAIATARRHLAQGTGDPGLEGRLLSIHASYCTDTGDFEKALTLAGRAVEIFRELEDPKNAAHNVVKEAGILLAAYKPREAIEKAKAALHQSPHQELRLQTLARFIIIECLVILGRPHQALHWFLAAQPVIEQLGDLGTRLRAIHCEARLLDGLGRAKKAEKLFRDAIKAYFEHELYKEAFITLLSLFESFCRRGALTKAAALCEAAIEATDQAGAACNEKICLAWKELLATVRVRQLSEGELVAARQYLVRNWSVARGGAFVLPGLETAPAPAPPQPAPPPPPEARPEGLSIPEALAEYEKTLLESALQETGGNLRATSRLAGLSRNGLKNKMRRFGL